MTKHYMTVQLFLKKIYKLLILALAISQPLFSTIKDNALEEGLQVLFFSNFGYTLLGVKPVSQSDNLSALLFGGASDASRVISFLDTAFQNSTRFIIRMPRREHIELIHIKCLLSQIKKNPTLKKFIHEKFGSEQDFIRALRKSSKSIATLLDYNAVLYGVCLGYGEQNSNFYIRRLSIGLYLKKFPIFSIYPFDEYPDPYHTRDYNYFLYPDAIRPLSPNSRFDSLEDEWTWLQSVENENEINEFPEPPFAVLLPGYASMKSDESEKLHEKYLRARDKLARLFCGKKFSTVIIEEASMK